MHPSVTTGLSEVILEDGRSSYPVKNKVNFLVPSQIFDKL